MIVMVILCAINYLLVLGLILYLSRVLIRLPGKEGIVKILKKYETNTVCRWIKCINKTNRIMFSKSKLLIVKACTKQARDCYIIGW